MSKKLKPRERARADQLLATIRDHGAANPRTGVFTIAYADADTGRCCWCDCPDDPHAPQYQQGHECCDGCPENADFVLYRFHGHPLEEQFPYCAHHRDNLIANMERWAAVMLGPIPQSFTSLSVLDKG